MAGSGPDDVKPPDLKQTMPTELPVSGNPRIPAGDPPRDRKGRRGKAVPEVVTPPPSHAAYAVSPGSVNDACNQILAESQNAVSTYEELKRTVESTKSWIFWAPSAHPFDGTTRGLPQAPPGSAGASADWTKLAKDPNPDTTAQLGAAEDNLLLEIADTITLSGNFVDQLNNAAQFYTRADKASVLPELTEMSSIGQAPSPGGAGTAIPAGSPKGGGVDAAQGGQDPSAGGGSGDRSVSNKTSG